MAISMDRALPLLLQSVPMPAQEQGQGLAQGPESESD